MQHAKRGATGWDQYSMSKAGLCLLTRALNDGRLAAVGVVGAATAADPGICATGVNVQHDLAATLGGRSPNTKALHNQAGSHAADGALPLALAALAGEAGDFFAGHGVRARSVAEAAWRQGSTRGDPMSWDVNAVDAFWRRLVQAIPGVAEVWAVSQRTEKKARDEL